MLYHSVAPKIVGDLFISFCFVQNLFYRSFNFEVVLNQR